tara:strand:+ start:1801 stop:2463 length:663 start_codon:yes stop_codon:yes gene_type:complete
MAIFMFKTEEVASFLAGQYVLLQLPGIEGPRAYSMCNLRNDDGYWQFIIKKTPGGRGTEALFERSSVGDFVDLDGPYGMAYLRTENQRDIVCIGGGSGLSPLMSILSQAARHGNLRDRALHLFYGARTVSDACVEPLISGDMNLAPRVQCVTAISELNGESWIGERGYIHEVVGRWLAQNRNASAFDFYFCGPPPMTNAVQKLLLEANVPVGQLHYDRFL